jgi:hypothetical protein
MARNGYKDGTPEEPAASRYDDELLSANWNPVLGLLEWSCARTAADAGHSASQQVREEDVETFLGRIYSLGN